MSNKSSEKQCWNVDKYRHHTGFVSTLGAKVLERLAPCPGERILDLGCGDGVLTDEICSAGAEVVGLDSSETMIGAARARGLDVRLGNAEQLGFDQAFEAVFSNAALHWMTDPDAVIAGVRRALKPGGRFVGEFGGHGNVAAITVALSVVCQRRRVDSTAIQPWYFPSAEAYRSRLEAHGFKVSSIELIPRPTPLPTDMEGWLRTMAGPFFDAIDDDEREAALVETVELLRPWLCDENRQWTADYVRLRFCALL
jgi:trans-aconitate methyltransferase